MSDHKKPMSPELRDGGVEPADLFFRDWWDAGSENYEGFCELATDYGDRRAAALPQWVDVNDRLPETHTEVMIAFDCQSIPSTGQLMNNGEWYLPREQRRSGIDVPVVTHWLPLPDVPEVKP